MKRPILTKEDEVLKFFETYLESNGRPHSVETHYGPVLTDYLHNDSFLTIAPWYQDCKNLKILQYFSKSEGSGWLMDATKTDVQGIVFSPFHASRDLTPFELACIMSSSKTPHQDLVAYTKSTIHNRAYLSDILYEATPDITKHMDYDLVSRKRYLYITVFDPDETEEVNYLIANNRPVYSICETLWLKNTLYGDF